MTELYLVRHAQAAGNLERRFQGAIDTDLTETGREQIEYLSKRFAGIPISAVYTSPLKRAFLTAQGIAEPKGLTPIVRKGLIEINGGAFENRLFTELEVEYKDLFSAFTYDPKNFPGVGGGESTAEVYDRMKTAILDIVAENPGKAVAVVSHGAAIRGFLSYALGYGLERMAETPWGGNTCVAHIVFEDGDEPKVIFHGDDSHLPQEARMPSYKPWRSK